MTERERLIELLTEAHTHWLKYVDDCAFNQVALSFTFEQLFADHLLSNGVIVPPCKVGDKVYKISRNKVKKCEVVFVGISADEKCSHFNFVENYADGTFCKSYSMVFDVIGKTVFLAKEEAEKALKERNEGK